MGTYHIENKTASAAYSLYGEELSKCGFRLRLSLEHGSVWEKSSAMLVMEFRENEKENVLILSFVRGPVLERIFLETDKRKLFERDYKKNSLWLRINKFKPYFLKLSYSGYDFSRLQFKRLLVRFADFSRCDFKNTSWHACKFHLAIDGGELFCVFRDCDFSGSNFLGVDFSRCQFYGCNFTGCTFRNCKFDGTIMDNCVLEDFDMIRCQYENLFFCGSGVL